MQLIEIKKLLCCVFYLVLTSNDIGNCEDGKLLTCATEWTGEWCRLDCKQFKNLEQALLLKGQGFIALIDADTSRGRCHYQCWKDCQPCQSIGNKNRSPFSLCLLMKS